MADRRCLVVVCHNGPVVLQQTAVSLLELGWGERVARAKAAHGFHEISFYWAKNYPRVDALRDSAIDLARRERFSHVLFLDGDMVFPTDTLERMLRHAALERALVSGLYVQRGEPYGIVALRGRFRQPGSHVDEFFHVTDYGEELVDVDVIGMGCALVPLDVIDAIGPRPWFEYKNDDHGWPMVSEDVPFCLKAQAAGYRIILDPTVKCGHIDTMIRDERWHKRYAASMEASGKRLPFSVHLEQRAKVGA